jgi:hypothetical protein
VAADPVIADYEALQCYTLAHGHPAFIHQHVVDAWAAQRADAHTKPIGLVFALIGLHLHVDRGLTGREVQRAHMALAQRRQQWPMLPLPLDRGAVTASTVMTAPAGPERDKAIDAWCASVWAAYRDWHPTITQLGSRFGPSA